MIERWKLTCGPIVSGRLWPWCGLKQMRRNLTGPLVQVQV